MAILVFRGPEIKNANREGILRGLKAGAEIIEQEARARCPRRTGLLASTVRSFVDEDEMAAFVAAGNKKAWYALLVEKGTARTPANPFMRSAVSAKKKAAERAFRAEIAGAL